MPWSKLDDNIFDHPKMLKAGEDAANLYVRGLVYCNRYLTDGHIPTEALVTLSRKREAARYSADLVRVGLWETHPDGGWTVHDFHDHNPTAAEVAEKRAAIAAKRSEAGKRGGKRSGETRSNEAKRKQSASADTKQNEANDKQPAVEATKQTASPIPSPPSGETTSLLSPVPTAPTTPPLELTPPEAPKAAKVKRAAPKPSVLPFSVVEALDAIASTSGGRFVPGDRSTWTKGWNIAIAAYVKRFPDLDLWRRVGAHVAAGGGWAKQTLDPQWAASDGFVAVVNLLPDWERRGSQVVDARFAVVVKAPPVAPPTASQPHAPKKVFLGEEFAAAAKAAREGK